jgi:response regulator RpfG family c-di-GMP phosphodiesterase
VVLVVDDDESIREVLSTFLKLEGFRVLAAENGLAALRVLSREPVSVVVTDVDMPIMDGLTLLDEVKRRHPEVVTLMSTADDRAQTVVDAMKRGAFDYVVKPFNIQDVIQTIGRALEHQRVCAENIELQAALSLYRLADELHGETNLDAVLTLCAETFRVQARADRVSIVLDGDGLLGGLELVAGVGPHLGRADFTEATVTVPQACVASDGRVGRYIVASAKTEPTASVVICPLTTAQHRLGWLVAAREGARPFAEGARKLATILADRIAITVQNAQLVETLERTFRNTIEAFVKAMEEKDEYTAGHSERVADYARLIAIQMGLSDEIVEVVHQGGRLHDIGKLPLRDDLLKKPGPLTSEEYELLKRHTTYGYDLLRPIPFFHALLPAVWSHHERWDGGGYPQGLAGEAIPLTARIMAVADSYDAMTSDRAYRRDMGHDAAILELRRCSGRQFDPQIVDAFITAIAVDRARVHA